MYYLYILFFINDLNIIYINDYYYAFFLKAQSVFACVVLAVNIFVLLQCVRTVRTVQRGGKASGIQLRRFIRAVAEVLEFEMKTSEALKLVLGPVGLNAWLMADESVSLFHF